MIQDVMRKHKTTFQWGILILIIVPFVFWGGSFGMRRRGQGEGENDLGPIAVVGDISIPHQLFRAALSDVLNQRRRAEPDVTYRDLHEDNTAMEMVERLVNETVLDLDAEDTGVAFDQDLLVDQMKKESRFQRDGKFDIDVWNAWIDQNSRRNWNTEYERVQRNLQRRLVLQRALAPVHVPDSDVRKQFEEDFTKLKVRYAAIDPKVEPTEEQIQAQYKDHPDFYTTPDQRKTEFVAVSMQPSAEGQQLADEEKAKRTKQAEDVASKAKQSGDLAAAAAEAGLTVATTGGYTIESMSIEGVPAEDTWPFRAGTTQLGQNEVSEIIKGKANFYVAKVIEVIPGVLKPFEETRERVVSDTIAALKAKPEHYAEIARLAGEIQGTASSINDILKAHPDLGLVVAETQEFTVAEFRPGMGPMWRPRDVFEAVGRKEPGAFAGPVEDYTGVSYFVELVSKTPPDEPVWKEKWEKQEPVIRRQMMARAQSNRLEDFYNYESRVRRPWKINKDTYDKILELDKPPQDEQAPEAEMEGEAASPAADAASPQPSETVPATPEEEVGVKPAEEADAPQPAAEPLAGESGAAK